MLIGRIKTWLYKQKYFDRREPTGIGPTPKIGAYIVKRDVAIKVIGKLTTDQWHWLLKKGWREVNPKNNRRTYYRLPKDTLLTLISSPQAEREKIYRKIMHIFE